MTVMYRCCCVGKKGRCRRWGGGWGWWCPIVCWRWTIVTIDTRASICCCRNHWMNVMRRNGWSRSYNSSAFGWVWCMTLLLAFFFSNWNEKWEEWKISITNNFVVENNNNGLLLRKNFFSNFHRKINSF